MGCEPVIGEMCESRISDVEGLGGFGQTRWRLTRIADMAREVGGGGFFGCRGSVTWSYEVLRVSVGWKDLA